MLQMLPEIICAKELLCLIALSEFVHFLKMSYPEIQILIIYSQVILAQILTMTNDVYTLGQASLDTGTGLPLTLVNASYIGGSTASGTFTNGPQGFGAGTILTTGVATDSLPTIPDPIPGVDNGAIGNELCTKRIGAATTYNAAVLDMYVNLPT